MNKELAIIEQPGYGLRDNTRPCLWFKVGFIGGKSLLVFFGSDASHIISSAGVYNVKDLAGKACVIKREGNSVEFVQIHKS